MQRNFDLENGIYCRGTSDCFQLFYKDEAISPICSSIAYVPKTLIVLKSNNTVYVYRPEVIQINQLYLLQNIAKFESTNHSTSLLIRINDKTYMIDQNVQISISSWKNKKYD